MGKIKEYFESYGSPRQQLCELMTKHCHTELIERVDEGDFTLYRSRCTRCGFVLERYVKNKSEQEVLTNLRILRKFHERKLSSFNKGVAYGFNEAIEIIEESQDRNLKETYNFTVYDVLVLTEFCGEIVDFGYNVIKVDDSNRDEIYALSVNCVYAENDKIVIHTFLNEREVIESELA